MINQFLSFVNTYSNLEHNWGSDWSIKISTKTSIILTPFRQQVIPLGFILSFPQNNYRIIFNIDWQLASNNILCLGNSWIFQQDGENDEVKILLLNVNQQQPNTAFQSLFGATGQYRIKAGDNIGELFIVKLG